MLCCRAESKAVLLTAAPCTFWVRLQLQILPSILLTWAGLLAAPLTYLVYAGIRSEVQDSTFMWGSPLRALVSAQGRSQGNMEEAGAELGETQEVTVMS